MHWSSSGALGGFVFFAALGAFVFALRERNKAEDLRVQAVSLGQAADEAKERVRVEFARSDANLGHFFSGC